MRSSVAIWTVHRFIQEQLKVRDRDIVRLSRIRLWNSRTRTVIRCLSSRKDLRRMKCMSVECPVHFRKMSSMQCTEVCRDWNMRRSCEMRMRSSMTALMRDSWRVHWNSKRLKVCSVVDSLTEVQVMKRLLPRDWSQESMQRESCREKKVSWSTDLKGISEFWSMILSQKRVMNRIVWWLHAQSTDCFFVRIMQIYVLQRLVTRWAWSMRRDIRNCWKRKRWSRKRSSVWSTQM